MVREISGWESLAAGLTLRSRASAAAESSAAGLDAFSWSGLPELLLVLEPIALPSGAPSLKMWTVSEAELTQRREEVALKAMLEIRLGMLPRRNW